MPNPTRLRSLRIASAVLAIPLVLSLAGCSNSSRPDENATQASPATATTATTLAEASSASGTVKVDIKTFLFSPKHLRVKPGTTVVWTNEDEILHTVTAGTRDQPAPARFDGQLDGRGTTFQTTFDEPGTFAYHCSRHPGMDADVEVG